MQNAKTQFKIQNLKKIKKELPGIQKNIPLAKYTTFQIGGKAKYFFIARTKENLIKAVATAKKLNPVRDKSLSGVNLPFFILGGGSNLLVSDKGYKGLVIKVKSTNQKHAPYRNKVSGAGSKIIEAEAGTSLGQLVNLAFKNNLSGLEWASGIPGTVGGAIRGNAGAFQKSIKDVVEEIEVFDASNKKIKVFKNKDCRFGYRESVFKKNKNLIILSAIFQLKKGNKKEIQKKIKEYLNYKKETQPLNYPSAGSIFKNVPRSKLTALLRSQAKCKNQNLLKKYSGFKKFNKIGEIPAGWLIEKCSLKGKTIGQAKISEKHANFIVNLGGARAEDVKKLINLAKKSVKNKFGIVLKEEIQHLGF